MARKPKAHPIRPTKPRGPRDFVEMMRLLDELENDVHHLYVDWLVSHDRGRTKEHKRIQKGFQTIRENLDSG